MYRFLDWCDTAGLMFSAVFINDVEIIVFSPLRSGTCPGDRWFDRPVLWTDDFPYNERTCTPRTSIDLPVFELDTGRIGWVADTNSFRGTHRMWLAMMSTVGI